MAGIYLPVLNDAESCYRHPVAVIYTDLVTDAGSDTNDASSPADNGLGHFSAVVGLDFSTLHNGEECTSRSSFPLVNLDLTPLPIRYSSWSSQVEEEVVRNDCRSKDPPSLLAISMSACQEREILDQYLDVRVVFSPEELSCGDESNPPRSDQIIVACCGPTRRDNDFVPSAGPCEDYTASTVYSSRASYLNAVMEEKLLEESRLKQKLRNLEVRNHFKFIGRLYSPHIVIVCLLFHGTIFNFRSRSD